MSNIRIDLEATVINGQTLTFKSPVDCSQITGLIVYYPEGDITKNTVFQFADAHGNNVGDINLFAENVLVKVILDTDLNRAYVQNADTNAYIEETFLKKAGGTMSGVINMGSKKITNVGTPTNDTDAANKKFVEDTIADAVLEGYDVDLSAYLQKSGGTMTGNLAMGGNKITGLGTPTANTDAVPLQYANSNYAPKSHTENKSNPHGVTASQVRARPDTWMPTASDVGAVPTGRTVNGKALSSNISLSASDVGARPNTWVPTASEVGAAPAGYGLGVAGSNSVSSVQNIDKNGWWLANGDTPDGGYWFCLPRMVNSGNNMVVDAWSLNGLYNAKISKGTGGFGAWEWVNPPMAMGVEYRTTERAHDRAVYCKIVNFGSGPNNTSKSVEHGVSNIQYVVGWHCYNINSGTCVDQATDVKAISVDRTNINVTSSANVAAWTLRFIIKYTKTTD